MDTVTKAKRSEVMSKIRAKNTKPEIIVRKILHKLGYRFSLHRRDLPGKPDIVLARRGTVVFVHGCFWHGHKGCARHPKSNLEYWTPKIERNAERDKIQKKMLKKLGWKVLTIWECELKNVSKLEKKIQKAMLEELR